MADSTDLTDAITSNATSPNSATADGVTVTQNPPSEQIEAEKYRGRAVHRAQITGGSIMPPTATRVAAKWTPVNRIRAWLASKLAPAVATPEARDIGASYDAAQTTRHNENHWANADALSPNAANTTGIRRVLRNRSRYEAGSNSLCAGVLRTIADHTVGTGPRIQFLDSDRQLNARLYSLWTPWWDAATLDNKLWVLKETQSDCAASLPRLNPRL